MKTISDVKKEIGAIENLPKVEFAEMKPVARRRLKKRLELLRILLNYLETNPTEEFVNSEIRRVEAIINSKTKIFDEQKVSYIEKGFTAKQISDLRKKHESMYDLKKLRAQAKNMRTLLK